MAADELGFGYRHSRIKDAAALAIGDPGEVVLSATFALRTDDPATIKERLDDIRRWRQAHQPLGLPSAGSVFRNPRRRLGRPADRRARAQGPPHRRGGRVREAR